MSNQDKTTKEELKTLSVEELEKRKESLRETLWGTPPSKEKEALIKEFKMIEQAIYLREESKKWWKVELESNTNALKTINEDLERAIEKLKQEKVEEEARLKKDNQRLKELLERDINTLIDELEVDTKEEGWTLKLFS